MRTAVNPQLPVYRIAALYVIHIKEWLISLGLTCHSEEILVPPSLPAADDPPAFSVHCEAADATLTAHWTHRAGHLKTHTQFTSDALFSLSILSIGLQQLDNIRGVILNI